jgi:hypothetical protein
MLYYLEELFSFPTSSEGLVPPRSPETVCVVFDFMLLKFKLIFLADIIISLCGKMLTSTQAASNIRSAAKARTN